MPKVFLTLFCILASLGVLFIFLGYYSQESAYSLIGFAFLFWLSAFILLPGNLEIKTGENTTYAYVCYDCNNGRIYENGTQITVSNKVIIDNYAPIDDTAAHFFGFWLLFVSIVGIAISLTEIKSAFSGKKNWRSE